ncbi:MAG: GmrSD restriction endonuclease domain-containing protein [Aggregatilineaceae bacterium]
MGSFLLWDSSDYQEAKVAQGAQASLWIVDGQQRTTALCLLLGMKPFWWPDAESWNKALNRYDVMVNLLPEDGDEALEFALPNPVRRKDARWISVREILSVENVEDLTKLAQGIATRNSADPEQTFALFGQIHARLHRLWQIRERDIPIIKIQHEVEDVAEIFARLNQDGTRVKEADVVLALTAVRNPGWVRKEYLPFRNDLEDRGWDLDAGIFVRTMTAIGHARARLIEVPKDFWKPDNMPAAWKIARERIWDVLQRLAEFGIFSADLLPSTNSLIPLFALHDRWKDDPHYRFQAAFRWFLLANRDGRYSGAAITALNQDVRSLSEADDFKKALENLSKPLRVSAAIDAVEFLERYDRAGNRFLRLMLYLLLFRRNARDWVDGTRLGYDKTGAPIVAGFEPQWHHIFPRHVLQKAEVNESDRHALANITVLNERTNVNQISGKEPWQYISKFKISPDVLNGHLIPPAYASVANQDDSLHKKWDVANYTDFVTERAQLLADEANAFLEELAR